MRGMTLYVVRNQLQQVAVLKLNARGTSGELVKVVTSNDFVVPTMVTAFGNSLYLPNARSTLRQLKTLRTGSRASIATDSPTNLNR